MRREADWAKNKVVPSLDDYVEAGLVSIAVGPLFLVALYFLGYKLSEEAARSAEFNDLFRRMRIIVRLLNDLMAGSR